MNRKKVTLWIGTAGCFVCILTGALHMNLTYSDAAYHKLTLHNVEVLAQSEGGSDSECLGSGSIVCGEGTYRVKYN